MVLALFWTLISVTGLLVALGVLTDTSRHYARFKKERPELVPAYRIEVVQDAAITVVQAFFATVGVLVLLKANQDLRLLLAVMLYACPILLSVASINHYWSRHRL